MFVFLGVSHLIFAVFVEGCPGSRADRKQTICLTGNSTPTISAPDPSLQITTLLAIVGKLTSKYHRLRAVITENNLHGLVRQRQTLEFWSYLVAEVRELEVVIAGDVRVAAMIQWDAKNASNVSEIECEYLIKYGGCRQGGLCPNKHVTPFLKQRKCYNSGEVGQRANDCSRAKANTAERDDRENRLPETQGCSGFGSDRGE